MSHITDQEINDLKNQVEAKKRQAEYDRLKQDLADITYRESNRPTEFDSGMQYPDTDRSLKDHSRKDGFVNRVIDRLTHMLSIRPITGNLISIAITISVIVIARKGIVTHISDIDIASYLPFITYLAIFSAGMQILKSSTRSLFLPLVATIAGGIISASTGSEDLILTFPHWVFQGMFIMGLLGLVAGAFSID